LPVVLNVHQRKTREVKVLRTNERSEHLFERVMNSQTRKFYAERLRQLNRLGFVMPLEFRAMDNSRNSEIVVQQAGPDIESPVFDLRDGRALYVVWLSLWTERPGVRLYDVRFEPPWDDHNFLRMPTFADSHIGDYYRLPNGLEYLREDVLNFNFVKTGWRLPNVHVEGVVCALSATSIPEQYKHGASIPVGIRFFGRSGQELVSVEVMLWADRWDDRAVTRPTPSPHIAGCVEDPDISPRRPRSTLYDRGAGDDSSVVVERREESVTAATKIREGSSRACMFGE
jgi:hypothetical protein